MARHHYSMKHKSHQHHHGHMPEHEKRNKHGEFEASGYHKEHHGHRSKHHSGHHGRIERHEKHHSVGPEYYSGASERHMQERKDMGMIHENHHAIANLPQEVMIKPWPMSPGYLPEVLDDGISGIDRQMAFDNSEKMGGFFPKKI